MLLSLQKNSVIPFFEDGNRWHLYEVLPVILAQTGSAHVAVSSFAISEEAVRMFSFEKEKGSILSIRSMLDFTTRKNKVDVMLFAANIDLGIRLTANHSKVLIITNEEWRVCLIGSANLTPNPRVESGVIFTNEIADYFLQEFNRYYDNAIPYAVD